MSENISRREFMRSALIAGTAFLASSCAKQIGLEPTEEEIKLDPTKSPTPQPTRTIEKTRAPELSWVQKHEQERLAKIEKYGVGYKIPALEYHSDNYQMGSNSGINIELTPNAFEEQMKWFNKNDYHAVTGDELIKYVKDSSFQLPAKSVILTFDMGNPNTCGPDAMERIVDVFSRYNMHGIFTLWTIQMDPNQELGTCFNDSCWEAYKKGYQKGVVTLGTHSNSHRDFSQMSYASGIKELTSSRLKIEEKTGAPCKILTWPFEAIPSWGDHIQDAGLELAFGGIPYTLDNNAVHKLDNLWFNLPRVLPPNSDNISARPYGKDLEEIMTMYTTPPKAGLSSSI